MTYDNTHTLLERIPPQDMPAEQAALGAMLLEREAIEWAHDEFRLREDELYRGAHQTILRGVYDLNRQNEPVDYVTLGTNLQNRGKLEEIGGVLYLQTLMEAAPTAAGIRHYCEIIREKAQLRAGIKLADEMMAAFYTGPIPDLGKLLTQYADNLEAIKEWARPLNKLPRLHEIDRRVYEQYVREHEAGEVEGVTTGLSAIDNLLEPLQPGDLCIVAGRPSMGKTLFAETICRKAAAAGGHTLFLSCEMSEEQIAKRAMTGDSLDLEQWETKKLHHRKAQWDSRIGPELSRVIDKHAGYDYALVRPTNLTPDEVTAYGKQKQKDGGLTLLVVDYLQIMEAGGRHRDRFAETAAISRGLKSAAVKLRVPIIAVAQLNRQPDAREDHRPLLSDLGESGQIERDADHVLMLYRDGYYCKDADPNDCEVLIRKQRNGKTGEAHLYMNLERALITSLM